MYYFDHIYVCGLSGPGNEPLDERRVALLVGNLWITSTKTC